MTGSVAAAAPVTDEPGRARSRDFANKGGGVTPYERARTLRDRRWFLVNYLQRETALERVGLCRKHRTFVAPAVALRLDRESMGRYGGLQTCGSVWACPLCSAAIRQRRVEQVDVVGQRHLAAGGSLSFLTLTVPHDYGDELRALLDVVRDGWAHVWRGETWRRMKRSGAIVGFLCSVEITHGYNGWHPHLHVLVFLGPDVSKEASAALSDAVERRWREFAVGRGYRAPSAAHGARWQAVKGVRGSRALAAYLTKVQDEKVAASSLAAEMLRGDLKRGRSRHRTPFELLEVAALGGKRSRQALALWHEYERTTKGRRALTGLAPLLRLYAPDLGDDDDQAAADLDMSEQVGDRVLVEFSEGEWRAVVRYKRRGMLLRVAEDRGLVGVTEALAALGRREAFDRQRAALRKDRGTSCGRH